MILILFRILWVLLIAFVVLCMVKAILSMRNYDDSDTEVARLRNDLAVTRWLLMGWIALSITWTIVRYI